MSLRADTYTITLRDKDGNKEDVIATKKGDRFYIAPSQELSTEVFDAAFVIGVKPFQDLCKKLQEKLGRKIVNIT